MDVPLVDAFILKATKVKFPICQTRVFGIVKAESLENRTLIENGLVTNVVSK
jgi:hypothetical protein